MTQPDGPVLAEAVRRLHPDPFRSVAAEDFHSRAERAAAPVELMALLALLGPGNGHTAIHPLDERLSPLHAAPLRLYELDDGMFVVAAASPELVGCELLAVAGTPVEELSAAVTPLVARDNEWTLRARRPSFMVTKEILEGLGLVERDGRVPFLLRAPSGARPTVEPAPVPAGSFARAVGPGSLPPYGDGGPRWTRPVSRGTALHVVYNVTRGETASFADEIEAAAGPGVGRIALDLRHNTGGDNTTYGPLLRCLERLTGRGVRLAVLISRATFSAAIQLVLDLERRTPAVFVGEPTGGSPNHFGDAVEVELPATGLTAHVATIAWTTAGPDDERAAREPDLAVPLTSSALFAGEDPALAAALRD